MGHRYAAVHEALGNWVRYRTTLEVFGDEGASAVVSLPLGDDLIDTGAA